MRFHSQSAIIQTIFGWRCGNESTVQQTWKLLIDKGMKKSQLREAVGASKSTFAKLGKNENVTLPVLLNICEYLECDFGDIMEAVPENEV